MHMNARTWPAIGDYEKMSVHRQLLRLLSAMRGWRAQLTDEPRQSRTASPRGIRYFTELTMSSVRASF